MIPNTIPVHYERKPTLTLPLKLYNNQIGARTVPIIFAALVFFLLFGFFLNRHPSLPYHSVLLAVLCVGVVVWLFIVFRLVCYPPQVVEIEQDRIKVRSGLSKSEEKTYPTSTLDYISLYGDEIIPNTVDDRMILTGVNFAMSPRGSVSSAIIDTWAEWSFFEFLGRTKIAIHTKNDQGTILVDVNTNYLTL